MLGALPEAAMLAGKIVFCALVSFAGAFLVLSAWFDRKISGNEAALLLTGLLAMLSIGVWLSMKGGPGMLLLAAIVLGVPLVGYLMGKGANRRLVSSFDEEDIAKYQAAIDFDPKNVAAHSLLAETYRRQGRLEMAIDEYRAALQLDATLNTERYWVQRLEAQLESQARKEMVCPRCNTSRPGDAQVCPECGRWYTTVEKSMQAVRVMPSARKAGWAGLVAVVFGGLIAVLALAPLLFVFLVIAAAFVAPLTVVVLEARARRRAGDRT